MTRTENALYRARHLLWIVGALLFLGGAIGVAFIQIDREARRADLLAQEADLRGTAVSTLAGDVRALRQQVQAEGETPVAPDPTRAVEDLPDRAEVPVPIPGPRGAQGEKGEPGASGKPGRDGVDGSPGVDGAPGVQGEAGVQGEQGIPGEKGEKGDTGERGEPGPTCPDGYSLQAPSWDPDALVCRRDGAPQPSEEPGKGQGSGVLALDPRRIQYA